MTKDGNRSQREQRDALGGAGQRDWVWTWPIMTLLFALFPALASMLAADTANQSFAEAAFAVAGWLSSTDAGSPQRVEVASGFGFLAVMATIVIGMAFSLPPGGVQALPKKNRDVIGFLAFGVVLLVSMFSTAVLWVIIWQQVTFDLVLLLLSAWLVSLVAAFVELKPPATERIAAASLERERLREAARLSGYVDGVIIRRRRRLSAEVGYWLIPVVGVPLLGAAGLLWDFGGFFDERVVWMLLFMLAGGAMFASVSWRVTASYPPHRLSDRVAAWAGRGFGLLLMTLVVAGALIAKSWGFAAMSAIAVSGTGLLLFSPASPSHVPFMKTIRVATTHKRLRRADEWYRTVSKEFDEEQRRATRSGPSRLPDREAILRIEVFRPGSRR